MNLNGNGNGHRNGNGNGNGFSSRWWSALWQRSDPAEKEAVAYRRLALQLYHDLSVAEGRRSALLVTPNTSSLCAQGSVAVAACLAKQVCRPVLLIDVCPENPEASRVLKGDGSRGFTDFLADPKLPIEDLVLSTNCENVSFLPAGTNPVRSNAVSPENVKALFDVVEAKYDYVLLSGGSVLKDPTTFLLAPHAGCVLLLVIENQTLIDDLDAAQDVLALCNASKVGLVFTKLVRTELWPI